MAEKENPIRVLGKELRPHALWALIVWVGPLAGGAMIAVLAALWQKLRHISPDWFFIGGLFVLSVAVLVMLLRLVKSFSSALAANDLARERFIRGGQSDTLSPSSHGSVPSTTAPTARSEREFVNVTPEYLIGFFNEGHMSIQAGKLAEAFIGKWITVSGPIGDVLGVTDAQRMAVFADRSIHDHNLVNMFFRDKERFNQLSTLKRGDAITVIGQLRDVNSLEIWLENCELVKP
jgi:hypothetical protein